LNKLYVQRPEVIKRRKELYQARKVARKLVEHGEPMLAFRKTPQILQRVEGGSQDLALSALGLTMKGGCRIPGRQGSRVTSLLTDPE